mgnify:CR=1 FL=1
MNRFNLLFSLLVFVVSCSAQQKTEQAPNDLCIEFSGDQVGLNRCCSNHCGQGFAACTERHPGDFSACSQERNSCETTCRGDVAIERMEKEQGQSLPTIVRPDAGSEPESDDGAGSAPAAVSAGETPE